MPFRPFMRRLLHDRRAEEDRQARLSAKDAATRARSRAQESLARLECRPYPAPVDVEPAGDRNGGVVNTRARRRP